MSLAPGTRIGPYEVVSMVGAGGMGEVYRARDGKLGRDVALKVLPSAFASDPERIARLEREARTLATLNHPHIGGIYGFEESNGVRALALELVDGETLADRIARGAIPLEDVLPIARQIADALEAAHEHGIIHRDLKPANIKMTPQGVVKVLDFGLAKLADAPDSGAATPAASLSPTITSPAMMTQAGMLLGTAAYMAPEQAKGKPADKRSDIWAFGCVLYEMLTGARAFDGEDVTETLASVLRSEVDWALLPPSTPAPVMRLLKRCVEKDSRRRLKHIGDARLELDERDEPPVAIPSARRPQWRLWPLMAAAVAGAIAGVAAWLFIPREGAVPVTRFAIPLPAGATLSTTQTATVALSPDGRTLVLSSARSGLLRRRLDGQSFEPIQGAESGSFPFFSPDSKWIGFREGGKLKKVPVAGGIATTLCDAVSAGTAAWGDNGSIIVSQGGDLYVVRDGGGALEPFLKADASGPLVQPAFVPGSKVLLARSGTVPGQIVALDFDRRVRHPLVEGTNPQIAATGELLFVRGGNLWAIRFDAKRLAVIGDPVIVVESLGASFAQNPLRSSSLFATSRDGSLVFIRSDPETNRSLVWLDRTGTAVPALPIRGAFQSPRLSPDGKRVAVSVSSESSLDLWTYELESGRRVRLTTQWNNRRNVWSPDGSQNRLLFNPAGHGGSGPVRHLLDGRRA